MVFVIVDCKEWTPRPRSLVYATVIIAVMRQNSYSSKTRAALKGLNPSGGSVSDCAYQELARRQIMSVDKLVGPPQQASTFASSKSRYLTDKLKECLTRKQDMQR